MKPLDVGMDLDTVKPQLNAAFDFIHWVFQPRVDGAEADEPVRMLLASGMDKSLMLCTCLDTVATDWTTNIPTPASPPLSASIHAADFVHGNRIKFSDAVRGLFRNLSG